MPLRPPHSLLVPRHGRGSLPGGLDDRPGPCEPPGPPETPSTRCPLHAARPLGHEPPDKDRHGARLTCLCAAAYAERLNPDLATVFSCTPIDDIFVLSYDPLSHPPPVFATVLVDMILV